MNKRRWTEKAEDTAEIWLGLGMLSWLACFNGAIENYGSWGVAIVFVGVPVAVFIAFRIYVGVISIVQYEFLEPSDSNLKRLHVDYNKYISLIEEQRKKNID